MADMAPLVAVDSLSSEPEKGLMKALQVAFLQDLHHTRLEGEEVVHAG